jgi:hypothetical protein
MSRPHPDTARLRGLDRRPPLNLDEIVSYWNARVVRPGSSWSLRPLQALALEEASLVRGGLFPLGVGSGKSLLSLLLPGALGIEASDALLLLPAELAREHARERDRYAEHFIFDPIPTLSYEMLSRPERVAELAERAPKLIIADEAHALRNKKAARTSRFLRYLRGPGKGTAFVAMSASLAATSLFDWAHLAEFALGEQTPLPSQWVRLDAWTRVLDPEPLLPASEADRRIVRVDLCCNATTTAGFRAAFLAHTDDVTGLVRSTEASTTARLVGRMARWTTPALCEVMDTVAESYVLPCGEEIEDPLRLADKLAQIESGFYYQADWSGNPPPRAWFYTRQEWTRALAAEVGRGRAGLDSPALVIAAVERGELSDWLLGKWRAWQEVRSEFEPKRVPVWIDDAPMRAAIAAAGESGLIWTGYAAQLDRLEALGVPVARPGERPDERHPVVGVSIASHGTGLNLQRWAHNVVVSCPASAGTWEQMLGRTRRAGQVAAAVGLVANAGRISGPRLEKAIERARYIEATQAVAQALCAVEWKI